MNEVTIFENPEFGDVRTVVVDGEPYLVGLDIAEKLGYQNGSRDITTHVDECDRKIVPVFDGKQNRQTIIINESGFYSLVFRSKMPKAKEFKQWVTSEVLPSIRKNGGYIRGQENLTPEQIVANALVVAQKIIEDKDRQLAEAKPKVEYFDNLVDSRLLTTFRDAAKELNIQPKQFTKWLTESGYIYRDRHGMIKPYEQYRKSGLFQMKDFSTPFGYSNVQTYITVKGKETFRLLMGDIKNDI